LKGTMLVNSPIFQCAIKRAAVAVTVSLVAATAHAGAEAPAKVSALTERYAVSGQITPGQLADLKARGFTSIVALRPDGEGPDQPTAAQMTAAAHSQGMTFSYVPVAPGPIPDQAVADLGKAIENTPGKVLMYCRSGSRASRTWSLLEASRPGGASADTILAAVKASGHSADDLRTAIESRVSARKTQAQ
jgi:uncharacterized protein (TIGR01244 family)